jgi:AraC-like DNA-binding protein
MDTSTAKKINQNIPFLIRPLQSRGTLSGDWQSCAGNFSFFKFIWIRGGSGRILIDMTWHAVKENTLFYVVPGQVCQLQTSAQTEGYVISFTESFIGEEELGFGFEEYAALINQFLQQPVMRIGEEVGDEIGDLACKMLKEYSNYFLLRSEMLRRYVKIFLIHIKRQLGPVQSCLGQNRHSLLVQKFIALLEKNYREKKLVADYAEQLAVSPSYLNEAVKKTLGYSAGHLIRQRIVLEAKRKALYSEANMKEVAYSLGFGDTAHFSKLFKNETGSNFTDFRRNNRLQ